VTAQTIGVGIHTVDADAYHADPCARPSLSASIAHVLIGQSPRHAWTQHPRLNPGFEREENERFDVGTVAHALLLQGEEIVQVCDFPDWRSGAAREARDQARRDGRIPLLTKKILDVTAMLDATRPQLNQVDTAPPLFTDGTPEQTLVWEEDGVLCRARADWLRDDYATIDDFKTTSRTANPDTWSRTLFGMGCDLQAAFYLRGLRALTGETRTEFRFVVQETFPPYALSVVTLDKAVYALADEKIDKALRVWRRCLETGDWPAYPVTVRRAELPSWEETRWLERLEEEEGVAA
jgi:hypothetical protein